MREKGEQKRIVPCADRTITQVAAETGVSADTLRFYERTGVLQPVTRASNGNRRYSDHDVARVEFVTKLRATGLSLSTVRHYAELLRMGPATEDERRQILEAHRQMVKNQIAELQVVVRALDLKIDAYQEVGVRQLSPTFQCNPSVDDRSIAAKETTSRKKQHAR